MIQIICCQQRKWRQETRQKKSGTLCYTGENVLIFWWIQNFHPGSAHTPQTNKQMHKNKQTNAHTHHKHTFSSSSYLFFFFGLTTSTHTFSSSSTHICSCSLTLPVHSVSGCLMSLRLTKDMRTWGLRNNNLGVYAWEEVWRGGWKYPMMIVKMLGWRFRGCGLRLSLECL